MIAYNRNWLDALYVRSKAAKWHREGSISATELDNINTRYTEHFYTPNLFVRIGLAFFCLALLTATMGLIGLLIEPNTEIGFGLFLLAFGIIWIVVLESWLIPEKKHFNSGIDAVLAYAGMTCIVGGLWVLFNEINDPVWYALMALPFLVVGAIRYLDGLFAFGAFYCSFFILLLLAKDIPYFASYLMPVLGMLFSFLLYYFSKKGQQNDDWRHYHGILWLTELLALIGFYASGNYFMVQSMLLSEFGMERPPLAIFYWIFTFAVPITYLFWGFRKKYRLMLDLGMAALVLSLLTFRHYYAVLPIEWVATLGGALLFGVAYWAIHYLKTEPGGYTYEAADKPSILQEIQQQLIEQTITGPAPAATKKESTGGGQFGGGGAGEDF